MTLKDLKPGESGLLMHDREPHFGFRAATTEKNYTTGLKYFNPTSKQIVDFNGNNERILGLCINPRETYLF